MKSERSIRGLACRWFGVAVLALLCSLLSASVAQAQVQTFFVVVPDTLQGEEREAYQECAERLNAALVNTGLFRANADAETQRTVSSCIGDTASATAKRECDLSIANVEVDWLMMLSSRQIGGEWKWGAAARSPAEGGAQKWGGDEIPAGVTDRTRAAYQACDALGKQFACNQGVAAACDASFGTGPVLIAVGKGTGSAAVGSQPRRSPVSMSALDVFGTTPAVVSVWIDGREAGSSSSQITGIAPGAHQVVLKATGYANHIATVNFVAGLPSELRGVRLSSTTATLEVGMAEPEVAEVLIDGRIAGRSGVLLSGVAPGPRQVLLRAAGYHDRKMDVSFEADRAAVLREVRLEPLPSMLRVAVNVMGASILVDDTVIGRSSGNEDIFEVPASSQTVSVRRDGYVTAFQRLKLQNGAESSVRFELRRGTGSEGDGQCPAGFVAIQPGSFMMGSPPSERGRADNEQIREVTIRQPYCIQVSEVTQRDWRSVIGTSPFFFGPCGDDCPAESVSWFDAVTFANELSKIEGLTACYEMIGCVGEVGSGANWVKGHPRTSGNGKLSCSEVRDLRATCSGYRLPTESEWEFAARAGTQTATYAGDLTGTSREDFGQQLNRIAWYAGNSAKRPDLQECGISDFEYLVEFPELLEVCGPRNAGTKSPNAWGVYDMLGNVHEWTSSIYESNGGLAGQPGDYVVRGGSWLDPAQYSRAAFRGARQPSVVRFGTGFRLVRTLR
jgi:sulfatase modifying factor 1